MSLKVFVILIALIGLKILQLVCGSSHCLMRLNII